MHIPSFNVLVGAAVSAVALVSTATAAPTVSRLTPPSLLFSTGVSGGPYIARFLPGQRFDLQATVRPDAGATIVSAKFSVDGVPVGGTVTLLACDVAGLPANTVAPTLRAFSTTSAGAHTLTVVATQSDGQTVSAHGQFQIIDLKRQGQRAKNVVFMIGDGLGIAHRSAARIMYRGVVQGKMLDPLEMDSMDATAFVATASLNSIVTDSAPGAFCYAGGNKTNNNQEGVFPDDTTAKFDNPRIELIGEYLARTEGKSLGIVTTADVFDATPAAFGAHTQDRGAGTGICDGYLDEQAAKANLTVLLGGGRKWFLPATTSGSARTAATDSVLGADLAGSWGVAAGASDPNRDLLADFQAKGFVYAPTRTSLLAAGNAPKLLGLFALSNMNVAKDKLDGRRGVIPSGATQSVVADYGFPDQPLLEEMTSAALNVLAKNPKGFVLMVEGASIDKQAHNMDSERWLLDTIEFDKAIGVVKRFAQDNPDTLIIVTADHECAGVNIIGASVLKNSDLTVRAASQPDAATALTKLRDQVVGTYDQASFPVYSLAADGYPVSTDVDYKMLIGYAANADRYEDWLTNPRPLRDSQQPFNGVAPLSTYPNGPLNRDTAGKLLITGQVPGTSAVHTGSDIPLTASGRGSSLFHGVLDNTDVFFLAMQAVLGGVVPATEK